MKDLGTNPRINWQHNHWNGYDDAFGSVRRRINTKLRGRLNLEIYRKGHAARIREIYIENNLNPTLDSLPHPRHNRSYQLRGGTEHGKKRHLRSAECDTSAKVLRERLTNAERLAKQYACFLDVAERG